MIEEMTPEQELAATYSAALDSVTLIDALAAKGTLTEEEQDTLTRNVEHLKIVVTREGLTAAEVATLQAAIDKG